MFSHCYPTYQTAPHPYTVLICPLSSGSSSMARVLPHTIHRTTGGAVVSEETTKDRSCVVADPSHQTREYPLGRTSAYHLASECSSTEIRDLLSRRTSGCLSTQTSGHHLARILHSLPEVLLKAEVAEIWSSSTHCQKMVNSHREQDFQGKDCRFLDRVEDLRMLGRGDRTAASLLPSLLLNRCCWGRRINIAHHPSLQLLLRNQHQCIARKKVILSGWWPILIWFLFFWRVGMFSSHMQKSLCTDLWSWGSLLVRAQDSWWKGCELESQQELQENFSSRVKLCVLTLVWYLFQHTPPKSSQVRGIKATTTQKKKKSHCHWSVDRVGMCISETLLLVVFRHTVKPRPFKLCMVLICCQLNLLVIVQEQHYFFNNSNKKKGPVWARWNFV